MTNNKFFTSFGLLTGALAQAVSAWAAPLDLSKAEDVIAANRRIHCSAVDGEPTWFAWEGEVFSRRQGEADQRLFKVLGMNVRQCTTVDGGPKGRGYRLFSREIMLYLDPKTGEVLSSWYNPWLGRTVSVMHVENDPVNQAPLFPYRDDGSPSAVWRGKQWGDFWQQALTIPLYYQNPLQGNYQTYVGGAYHATEMFHFAGSLQALVAGDASQFLGVSVAWTRLSDWLPWMEMSGREGALYIHASGAKVANFEALPTAIQRYIELRAPVYRFPPQSDDRRPNQTSWSVFKAQVPEQLLR